MKMSARGYAFLKNVEGLELESYPDPASHLGKACIKAKLPMRKYQQIENWRELDGYPWTIGYGTTIGIRPGMRITEQQANDLLVAYLTRLEKSFLRALQVPVTQNQFDALVSWAYNVGTTAALTSTLVRKLNAGDYLGAAAEFGEWRRPPIVVKRRAKEHALFIAKE